LLHCTDSKKPETRYAGARRSLTVMFQIALLFSEKYPIPEVAGRCFPLYPDTGTYSIGRNGTKNASSYTYDISIPDSRLSRTKQSGAIFWNTSIRQWQILEGVVVEGGYEPFPRGIFVNGQRIPIDARGYPDPVTINVGDKILIGGDPENKILVVPECESTLSTAGNPFAEDGWGDGYPVIEVFEQIELEPDEFPSTEMTTGLSIHDLQGHTRNIFIAGSLIKGQIGDASTRLADPKTRGAAFIEALLWVALVVVLATGVGIYYLASSGRILKPANESHQSEIQ